MKKTITATCTVLLAAFLFSSCQKEYTCECTYSAFNIQGGATEQYTLKSTKRKAEKTCKDKATSVSAMGITVSKTCSLR